MAEYALQVLNELIPTLLYLLALVAIFYVKKLLDYWLPVFNAWIDAHVSEKTQRIIKELGYEAFAHAETVFRETNGADKLQEAIKYFNAHMSRYGLSNLTAEAIRAAIEKAWLENKQYEQPAEYKIFRETN